MSRFFLDGVTLLDDNDDFELKLRQIDGHLKRIIRWRYPINHWDDLYQEAVVAIYIRYLNDPDFFTKNTSAYIVSAGIYGLTNKRRAIQTWDTNNNRWEEEHEIQLNSLPDADRYSQIDIRVDLQNAWATHTSTLTEEEALDDQRVLNLFLNGYTAKETAQRLGYTVQYVNQLRSKLFRNLRTIMEAH